MEWKCHICGKVRPDRFISVYSVDVSAEHNLPYGTMRKNVRYCNDNLICMSKAPLFKLSKK